MGVEVAILLYSFGLAPNTAIVNDMKDVELIKVRLCHIFVFASRQLVWLAPKERFAPSMRIANGIPSIIYRLTHNDYDKSLGIRINYW